MKFEEQKEVVAVERILRVVFIDPQRASPVSTQCLWIYIRMQKCLQASGKFLWGIMAVLS